MVQHATHTGTVPNAIGPEKTRRRWQPTIWPNTVMRSRGFNTGCLPRENGRITRTKREGTKINASNLLCNDKCSFTVWRRFCHPLLLYTIYYVQKYYVMCLFIISLQKFNITSCDTVYRHRLFLKLLSFIMNRNKRC